MSDLGEDRFTVVDGVRLHYVEAGPASGPLVVLLHGFPEFWFSWRHQIPALAGAGFRVVALDMRGYNLSDKPKGVDAYRMSRLCGDVAALIAALGAQRASVVGHDWGGGVAWSFAMAYPAKLDRLVIVNAPHPRAFLSAIRTVKQLRRSWYMFFFQVPWLPEAVMRADGYRTMRRIYRTMTADESEVDRYIEATARPGALTAGVNYYRAVFRGMRSGARSVARVDAPTLVIWGERDPFLGSELAAPDRDLVPHMRVERLPDASHWVQLERPDRVNALLVEFLRADGGGVGRS